MDKLDYRMLRAIDGERWSRVEFEERCRLRILRDYGVIVRVDDHRIVRVDWAAVPPQSV